MRIHVAILAGTILAGCGGDSGEPLRSGTLTGEYADAAFTPVNGFVTVYQGQTLLALGDGAIHCGTESGASPPTGTNAIFFLPTTTVAMQAYTSVEVQLLQTSSTQYDAVISQGDATITGVTADAVTGSVSFTYTDLDMKHYSISGTFEVTRCP